MTLGVIMLVHTALDRAEQVARHWAKAGCPVVIHVDRNVPTAQYLHLKEELSDLERVAFSTRHKCEWGSWGLVAASQDAATKMLNMFKDVRHVYLSSGSCLPLRPIAELKAYLDKRPRVDFIESAATLEVPWTVGGLSKERFTLYFPFSWRKNRYLFDKSVEIQRKLGVRRSLPKGVKPHMGSQWWCLTRNTLEAILTAPDRPAFDAFFKRVWIPDESYFQTLTRVYSTQVESRSLTLSKFDFQGKPHIFYDDHLQLLRRSDCFVARKIWPHANRLYDAFLTDNPEDLPRQDPTPEKIDRIFARALDRRVRGRPGLYMQSRFPNPDWENGITAARYFVFQGFSELFMDFEKWLSQNTEAEIHGHLFKPEHAEFSGGQSYMDGALPNVAKLRDHNPRAFLANLIWNTRASRQCFQFSPSDNQNIANHMIRDPNAQIHVIAGAWAVPLFHAKKDFAGIRSKAARLQMLEARLLDELRSPAAKARSRVWTMAEFIQAPMEPLQSIVTDIGAKSDNHLISAPEMNNLDGFGRFLQNLKNQGMHPFLMGDFPVEPRSKIAQSSTRRKPYLKKYRS